MATDVINKELISSLLSLADGFLKLADTGLGQIITQITLLTGIGWGATGLLKASKVLPNLIGQFTNLGTVMSLVSSKTMTLTEALTSIGGKEGLMGGIFGTSLGPIMIITTVITLIVKLVNYIKNLPTDLDRINESLSNIEDIQGKIDSNTATLDLIDRYDELKSKVALTAEESEELLNIQQQLAETSDGFISVGSATLDADIAKYQELLRLQQEYQQSLVWDEVVAGGDEYVNLLRQEEEYKQRMAVLTDAEIKANEYRLDTETQISERIAEIEQHFRDYVDAYGEHPKLEAQEEAMQAWHDLQVEYAAFTGGDILSENLTEANSQILENVVYLEEWRYSAENSFNSVTDAIRTANNEYQTYADSLNKYEQNVVDAVLKGNKTVIEAKEQLGEAFTDEIEGAIFSQLVSQYLQGTMDLKEAADKYGISVSEMQTKISEWKASLTSADSASSGFTQSIHEQIAAFSTLEDELIAATQKLQEFQDATSSEKGDTFKQYATAFQTFLDAYEQGLIGSEAFQAGIELFFPSDKQDELQNDYQALGELLGNEFWSAVFSGNGEDYGANVISALSGAAKEIGPYVDEVNGIIGTQRDLVDSNDDVIASFVETSDGIQILSADWDKIGEEFEVDEGLLGALADALEIFGIQTSMSSTQALGLAESLDAIKYTADGVASVDLQTLVDNMVAAGATEQDIRDVVSSLGEIEGLTFGNPISGLDDMITKAMEAQTEASNTEDALDDVDDSNADPTVTLNTTSFDREVIKVQQKLDHLATQKVTIPVTISQNLKNLNKGYASGTSNAPGGTALVNEEGPELIQEGNTARIAGGGLPTVTNLEKGATVYTAEETQDILSGRRLSGVIDAFVGGGGVGQSSGFIPRSGVTVSGATGSTGGSNSGSSSGGSSGGISSASASVATQAIVESNEDIINSYKNRIDLLKSEYDLLEKQNASTKELNNKSQEVCDVYSELIEYMKTTSEYVNGDLEAQKDVVDYTKETLDWQQQITENLINSAESRKDHRDYLESQLKLMEAQGVSEEKRIEIIKQIQNELHIEAETLRELVANADVLGLNEAEVEEILKHINELGVEWFSLQSDINDLYESMDTRIQDIEDSISRIVSHRDLLESELTLMEAQGASVDSRQEKMKAIQDSLHEQAEELRNMVNQAEELGLSEQEVEDIQTEINGLSSEWWDWQDKIHALDKDILEVQGSLLKSEYELLEAQSAEWRIRVQKIREVQDNLHEEAELLRENVKNAKDLGLSEEEVKEILTEINGLSKEWWSWQNKLNDISDEVLQNYLDMLDAYQDELDEQKQAIEVLQGFMQDYYQNQIDDIDAQIEALQANNKELKKQVDLEEKLDKLARARQTKTMVYKDGHWQYAEDIDAVSAAASELDEYLKEESFNETIDGLEAQKDALGKLKDEWSDFNSDYQKIQNQVLLSQQLGIDTTLKGWEELVGTAGIWANKYIGIMESVKKATDLIGALTGGLDYDANVDYSEKILNSKTYEEAVQMAALRDAKMLGEGIDQYDSTESFLNKWKSAHGYANGTLSSIGGLSLVGEKGAELRVLGQGDGIIPHDLTRNLMAWGQLTPNQYSQQVANSQSKNMNVTIQALNLPNVTDGQGFVEYIRNNLFGQVLSFVH